MQAEADAVGNVDWLLAVDSTDDARGGLVRRVLEPVPQDRGGTLDRPMSGICE
ncbi:hypothetical protein [Actinocorallia libanotica]|uniref:hypothetical protein n=1 Tax=Actinocorallia libanotica TaxID=46162 RepID=UPI0031DCFA7B